MKLKEACSFACAIFWLNVSRCESKQYSPSDLEAPVDDAARTLAESKGRIASLELVNAITDTVIAELVDGLVIAVSDIDGMTRPAFNILATAADNGKNVRSVTFAYKDEPYHRTEYVPFAFCGNDGTNFGTCPRLGYGDHSVTATPYSKNNATGTAGDPFTVSFSIVKEIEIETDEPTVSPVESPIEEPVVKAGRISSLQLINAKTNRKIMDLKNGTVVYVGDVEGISRPSFNINATVGEDDDEDMTTIIRSVLFKYNRFGTTRIENGTAPYAFCGNNGTNFFRCRRLVYGDHTVTATPYTKSAGNGLAGEPFAVSFTIVEGSSNVDDDDNVDGDDTSPPELLDLVALSPSTVDVSLENAVFAMQIVVQDDLSGFESGYVAAYDKERALFHASADFSLPTPIADEPATFDINMVFQQTTPSGIFDLQVYLIDDAGNEVDIQSDALLDQSFPSFVEVVNSGFDGNPPELLEFFVVSSPSVNVTSTETPVVFSVVVQDEGSGFNSGRVIATLVGEELFFSFETYFSNEGQFNNSDDGVVELEVLLEISEFVPIGNYTLTVELVDNEFNVAFIETDELNELNFAYVIDVFNSRFDAEPPVVIDVMAVSATNVNVSLSTATVEIQVVARDDLSGVQYGTLQVIGPDISSPMLISDFVSFDDRPIAGENVTINFELEFPRFIEAGKYTLELAIYDNSFNALSLSSTMLAIMRFPSFVMVDNSLEDRLPPKLIDLIALTPTAVNITNKPVEIKMQILAEDRISGLESGFIEGYNALGDSFLSSNIISFSTGESAAANFSLLVPPYIYSGEYDLQLQLTDIAGNVLSLGSNELMKLNFPSKIVVLAQLDEAPPELLKLVSVTPTSVNTTSGPVDVIMKLEALDALSGIRYVAIDAEDPDSGLSLASWSFFDNEPIGGESVGYEARLSIPQYVKKGKYLLTVSLTDAVENSVFLTSDDLDRLQFPSFINIVSSVFDGEPPELLDIKAFTPTNVNVTNQPATVELQFSVQDDVSGVEYANLALYLLNEGGTNVGDILFFGELDLHSSSAVKSFKSNVSIAVPRFTRAGDYGLYLEIVDRAGNINVLDPDVLIQQELLSKIQVVNIIVDESPPEILDFVAFSPTTVNVTSGATFIKMQIVIRDDFSGLEYISVTCDIPEAFVFWSESLEESDGGKEKSFNFSLTIPRFTRKGSYDLKVYVSDFSENRDEILSNELARLEFPSVIVVENSIDDDEPPELLNVVTLSSTTVNITSSEIVSIDFNVTARDNVSGVGLSFLSLYDRDTGSGFGVSLTTVADSGVAGNPVYCNVSLELPRNQRAAEYEVQVELSDKVGNSRLYDGDELSSLGFPSQITVINTNTDFDPPVLLGLLFSPEAVDVSLGPKSVNVQVTLQDDESDVRSALILLFSPIVYTNVSYATFVTNSSNSGEPVKFNVTLLIPQYIASDNYPLYLTFFDDKGNEGYSDEVESSIFIEVINSNEDTDAPELLSFTSVTPTTVDVSTGPALVVLQVVAKEELSGLSIAYVGTFEDDAFYFFEQIIFDPPLSGANVVFNATFNVDVSIPAGEYFMGIYMYDAAANEVSFRPSEILSLGLPAVTITIVHSGF